MYGDHRLTKRVIMGGLENEGQKDGLRGRGSWRI